MGVSYNRLPTAKEISEILAKNSAYDVAPYDDSVAEALSFRNCLEGWPHNGMLFLSLLPSVFNFSCTTQAKISGSTGERTTLCTIGWADR